jgi:hypothetical protein
VKFAPDMDGVDYIPVLLNHYNVYYQVRKISYWRGREETRRRERGNHVGGNEMENDGRGNGQENEIENARENDVHTVVCDGGLCVRALNVVVKEGVCCWDEDLQEFRLVYPMDALRKLFNKCKETVSAEFVAHMTAIRIAMMN